MNHLHLHTQYSLLDGLTKPEEAVRTAKALGASALAVTDHASISAMPELMKAAGDAGIRPIIGCEFYVVERWQEEMKGLARMHLCVWAKSWSGVQSMMRQLTLANRQFYRRPLLTLEQATGFEDCMVGTACCFGVLSGQNYMANAEALHRAYGDDLYIELMPHSVIAEMGQDAQRMVNLRGVEVARKLGVKLLATNDSHYTREEDAAAHHVLMATQYNKWVDEYEGWPPVYFMRSVVQMYDAFIGLGYLDREAIAEAMTNTVEIVKRVDIRQPVFPVSLPHIVDDEEAHLADACLEGWKAKLKGRLGKRYMEYRKRLLYELQVINQLRFAPYFIMVQNIIKWARKQGIMVGPARGSAAGSLVCYLMDITRVDPIEHGLYFERFLNPERNDYPDIDVDFQDNRRDEVLAYIRERYGEERVCGITTYNEMGVKGAFRDVCRAYGIDMLTINLLSKRLDAEEDFVKVPELAAFAKKRPEIVAFSKRLTGVLRGAGVHACGTIISSRPIEEVAVVEKRKGAFVSCWDKRLCESYGLIKMDVLGLTTLSVLDRAIAQVRELYGVEVVPEKIDLEDGPTLDAFRRGETECVFQFESSGMRQLLKSLRIEGFHTLADCTALYRPGPLGAGLTEKYARVSRGKASPSYFIPELEPILGSTNGVMVYQEQIMNICAELAGFTWAEADKMRKIIGKKLGAEAFEKHRGHFVEGCKRRGIDERRASALFSSMVSFAEYSFNKSHAVAYTMISFWCMWFKVNFPGVFLAAYLSCVESEESVRKALAEVRRLGIPVCMPDINASTTDYRFDLDNGITIPLSAVKGVGERAVAEIVAERERRGMYLSLDDLQSRVNRRVVNKRVIESLVKAGAFCRLGAVEEDRERRETMEAEMLPALSLVPSLSLNREAPIDAAEVDAVLAEAEALYKDKVLAPVIGSQTLVMIVNNQMKGESRPGGHRMTKGVFEALRGMGLTARFVSYVTPVLRDVRDNPKLINNNDRVAGENWLRRIVAAVRPKLLYCCSSEAFQMFAPGRKMSAHYGRVIWLKEVGCWLLAGPSPQYAYCRPDDARGHFDACMAKIGEMFNVQEEGK